MRIVIVLALFGVVLSAPSLSEEQAVWNLYKVRRLEFSSNGKGGWMYQVMGKMLLGYENKVLTVWNMYKVRRLELLSNRNDATLI